MDTEQAKAMVEHHLAKFVGLDIDTDQENLEELVQTVNSLVGTLQRKGFIVFANHTAKVFFRGISLGSKEGEFYFEYGTLR